MEPRYPMALNQSLYGQASGVPCPPPPMVWSGRGGGACAETGGGLELPPAGGVVLGGRPRKPFASRIPYNVARAPVLINLNLYFLNPTPNPKPRLNAGSKPKAEHTPHILP